MAMPATAAVPLRRSTNASPSQARSLDGDDEGLGELDPAGLAAIAAERLLAGAEKYLRLCPGVMHYHCGQMAGSHRDVVEQSYQVGLNLVFEDRAAQDTYQDHPLHVEFVEKIFQPNCERVVVYDFES